MVVYRNLTKIQNLRYCAIPFFLHQHFYIRADVYVCVFFMQYKHISFANYTHRQAQQRQGQHLHQQSTRRNKSKNKLCFRYVGYIYLYIYIYIYILSKKMDTFHHEYCFPMCRFTLQHCRFLKQNGSSISLNFVFGRSLSFLLGSGFRCGSREMHFHSINQVVEVNATLPNIRSHTFKDTLALRVLQVLVLLFRANLFVKTRQLAYSVNMCNFSDTQH